MDLIQEICRQDLKAFMGFEDYKFKGNMTRCTFHDDHVESLSVNQKKDTGGCAVVSILKSVDSGRVCSRPVLIRSLRDEKGEELQTASAAEAF